MKAYDFLKTHEYYSSKREFSNHTAYVFRKPLEDGKKRFGTIQVPTTTEGTFDFYFSNDIIEPWFQELLDKSRKKSEQLFRIKKLVEGKVES